MKKKINLTMIITTIICLLPIIPSIIMYSDLPSQIPIHFNSQGVADNYLDKAIACFVLPLGFAVLNIIVQVCVNNDPKKENASGIIKMISFWLVPIISIFCMSISLLTAVGESIPVHVIVPAFVGVFICAIGNYLPKCRQNYTVGIKLPWTLSSEDNWNKTHRLAGVLWIVGGIIIVALALFPSANFSSVYTFISIIILMVITPGVYSYSLYKKANKS